MKRKKLTDSNIGTHIKRNTGKGRRRRAVLVIAVLAGGSYAVYRYIRMLKVRRAQELSEKLRSERYDSRPNDRECASAYFEGYKNGLDDGYDEGYERGVSEGEVRGIDDGYDIGYEEALRTCMGAANETADDFFYEADKNVEEDEIHEDDE